MNRCTTAFLFINTTDITHPTRDAQRQQIELAVMRQMPANRIQHPLWQFLAAIHRNLPGSMT